MAIVVGLALFFGRAEVIVLFAIISLFALREFITLAPTRSGRLLRCWPRSTSCCRQYYLVDRLVRHVHAADPGLCIPVPADPVDHRR
jgi:predicted CDP-diglyceride synthetase/phosphatidate cytidylyltransferase